MRSLHPASTILLGFAFLITLSTRSGYTLMVAAASVSVAALVIARAHFLRIVRRSRWLFLTMLILFGWMTPGTPLVGLPGATSEGLLLAAESVARVALAVAIVALILGALPLSGLVYGLRTLLAPIASFGGFRDRLAVRLMLTLQEVEARRGGGSSEADLPVNRVVLTAAAFGYADYLACMLCVGLLLYVGWA